MRTQLRDQFRPLLAGSIATLLWLSVGLSAHAGPITYTFTGVGTGTVDGIGFSGDFTFVFTGDTANVTPSGGEFRQDGIGGTFSEGSFSGTLWPTTPWCSIPLPLPHESGSSTVLSITAGRSRIVRSPRIIWPPRSARSPEHGAICCPLSVVAASRPQEVTPFRSPE